MDRYGNLSSQNAPTLLFHYTFLFEEEGFLFIKTLKWKARNHTEFLKFIDDEDVNVAVLVPENLKKACEKALGNIPFRCLYTYSDLSDIKRLSDEPWHNIVMYFDEDGQRGGFFGLGRWKNK